jgi:hypothetical protein
MKHSRQQVSWEQPRRTLLDTGYNRSDLDGRMLDRAAVGATSPRRISSRRPDCWSSKMNFAALSFAASGRGLPPLDGRT